MGMSSYILDQEEKFIGTDVPEIIKDSDTLEEAIKRAEEKCLSYQLWGTLGLDERVKEMWDLHWEKYNV
jgi:hypothetical protein|tara:strand:+ start:199 stop:405 length:207 start_codon:yes stop_codon:yes gene_type:complete